MRVVTRCLTSVSHLEHWGERNPRTDENSPCLHKDARHTNKETISKYQKNGSDQVGISTKSALLLSWEEYQYAVRRRFWIQSVTSLKAITSCCTSSWDSNTLLREGWWLRSLLYALNKRSCLHARSIKKRNIVRLITVTYSLVCWSSKLSRHIHLSDSPTISSTWAVRDTSLQMQRPATIEPLKQSNQPI